MKTRTPLGEWTVARERGFALVTSLIVSAVLGLLAASALVYARSGAVMAERDERQMQAYYLARSGAGAVAAWMEDHPQEGHALIGRETTAETPLGDGAIAKVRVYYKDPSNPRQPNGVVIESRGRVGQVERTVYLYMTENYEPQRPNLDMAVFSLSSISLSGSARIINQSTGKAAGTNSVAGGAVVLTGDPRIEGSLYIGPGGDPSTVVSCPSWQSLTYFITGGVANLEAIRSYPPVHFPPFPEDLPQKPALVVHGGPGSDVTIEGDGYYPGISVQSDRRLTVRLNGGQTRIRVGELDVSQGHIVLEGEGKLVLYVDSRFDLGGSSTINVNPSVGHGDSVAYKYDGDPLALTLYYEGAQAVSPAGATRFVGTFFSRQAEIEIGGSGGLVGAIITSGSRVRITGDASADVRVLYAPLAAVEITGSGKLKGAIVAGSFSASGAASVVYSEPAYEFPLPVGPETYRYRRGYWR